MPSTRLTGGAEKSEGFSRASTYLLRWHSRIAIHPFEHLLLGLPVRACRVRLHRVGIHTRLWPIVMFWCHRVLSEACVIGWSNVVLLLLRVPWLCLLLNGALRMRETARARGSVAGTATTTRLAGVSFGV